MFPNDIYKVVQSLSVLLQTSAHTRLTDIMTDHGRLQLTPGSRHGTSHLLHVTFLVVGVCPGIGANESV